MTQGVAAERVAAQQHHVNQQHDCSQTDPKPAIKPERLPNVVSEYENEDQRDIKKVAVDVLHDERERPFAEVSLARLTDGARRRIRPERLVICASIIIAGESEAARRPEDEQGR